MKTYTYEQIEEKYGKEVATKAIESQAEPTSRLMYPAFESTEHIGKNEWAGEPIEVGNDKITAYYYLTDEDENNLDYFDWEGNAEFQIEEVF